MNSAMVHRNNRSAVEDGNHGIAIPSTGYLPPPTTASGLASFDPGVTYDHRDAVDTLGAQHLSLGTNVSLIDVSPSRTSHECHS